MTSTRHCARCGAPLPMQNPLGSLSNHCPACLLQLALTSGAPAAAHRLERFDGYELGPQLGRGAMGVVYQAVQLNLRRPVALKMILDSQLAGPGARRRSRIEAEAAAKLDHPNIVPIYEVGEWEDQPFLSMKLVRGQSLRENLAAGELGLAKHSGRAEKIARFMATVARAVAHAHEHGVLHRDLKPANILVDAEGQPHLTDFGLAKLLGAPAEAEPGSATVSGSVLGTPSYMSPEQAAGRRLAPAADIYSLGAILYELLTGQPPFKAPTVLETLRLLAEQEPVKPRTLVEQVPRDLETICLKCLEKEPAARYPSAAALAEDLECWLQKRPIRAQPAGPLLRVCRWIRRNPVGAALILALCLGLSASLALLWSHHQREVISQEIRDILTLNFYQQIEKVARDPNESSVYFKACELAAFCGYRPRPINQSNTLHLTLAIEISGDPLDRGASTEPVLRLVEDKMQKLLGRPVAFDLRLQKHTPDVGTPVANGQVDFQRLGPLAYIRAAQSVPGLQPLVRERAGRDGVIFARKDLGITRLDQVVGRRVAFAHTNSIVSFWAKVQLARAGIRAKDLRLCRHLDPPRVLRAENAPPGIQNFIELEEPVYAHKVVIDAVLANEFDVGEARLHDFERHRHEGLVELRAFSVSPRLYVARPGLDTNIFRAFQQSLLSLRTRKEIELLKRMYATASAGFDPVTDADLNEVRAALTKEIRQFEGMD